MDIRHIQTHDLMQRKLVCMTTLWTNNHKTSSHLQSRYNGWNRRLNKPYDHIYHPYRDYSSYKVWINRGRLIIKGRIRRWTHWVCQNLAEDMKKTMAINGDAYEIKWSHLYVFLFTNLLFIFSQYFNSANFILVLWILRILSSMNKTMFLHSV